MNSLMMSYFFTFFSLQFFLLFFGMLILNLIMLFLQTSILNLIKQQDKCNISDIGWVWLQLVPLVGFIATAVTLLNIKCQLDSYLKQNNLSQNINIIEYKNTYAWIYFALYLIGTMLFSFIFIVAGVFLLLYIIHLYKVKNSIILAQKSA